jgi:enoyl-CoA hydratase/carnithine racemase
MLGHRFRAQEALDNDLVDAIATEKEVLQKAKEIAKSVAPKVIIGGTVYTMIRQEIVADTIHKLENGGLGFIAKF